MITPSFSLTATERVLPRLALDFTIPSLDPRVTFTRSGNTATVVNSSGYVAAINADLPRFDYDPVTLLCKGLLIEEARTNLLANSQNIASLGLLANGAVNSDVATSPDSTTNADEFYENTAAGTHYAGNNFSFVSGTTYTLSVFAKKPTASTRWLRLLFPAGSFTTATSAIFNLATGAIENQTNTPSATIQSFGNGWYRCSITKAATVTAAGGLQIGLTNGLTASYTGDGTSGLYIWGAQLEAGAFATSYIPTTSAALTRNADVATMTGTNFSDWYSASQGMFRVDASTPASGTRALISADDNTSGNSIVMSTVGTAPKLVVTQSSAEQANVSAGTITANTAMFVYASYAANYFGIARPSARQVDTSGTVPTVDRLRIGADQSGNYANGIIQAVQFWP